MRKTNNNQLTSSRRVGMRDINALLQTAPISRIKTLRDDEGRSKNIGRVFPDNESRSLRTSGSKVKSRMRGQFLFNLINPSRGLRAFPDYDLPGQRLPARGEEDVARGFTLIELLIVVFIIGILSAVALPQYRMVVDKARLANMIAMAKSVEAAQEVYYLSNGAYATRWEDLDISYSEVDHPSRAVLGNYKIWFDGGYVIVTDAGLPNVRIYLFFKHGTGAQSPTGGGISCYAWPTDTWANKLCKNLTQKTTHDESGGGYWVYKLEK